ncbi:hypothetical protein KFU94_09840 [Chloroflexi bacterium TSY]|nr:hypothetical protein [Chloroflexi bacterium TSY]
MAYLAVEVERVHTRDALSDLFWPGYKRESARTNLRQTLYQLRRALNDQEASPPYLLVTSKTIQFNPHSDNRRDTALFAHSANSQDDKVLEETIGLYRGDFLAGYQLTDCPEFEQWLLVQREYFRRLALDMLNKLTSALIISQNYIKAQQFAKRQLELDNTREPAYRQLMFALAHSGRRAEALHQYGNCQQELRKLDVAPDAETHSLYAQIKAGHFESGNILRRQSPLPIEHVQTQQQTINNTCSLPNNVPIRSVSLIGRDAELSSICDQLLYSHVRLLTLTGMGGIGKTQLAQAAARRIVDAEDSPFIDGIWYVSLAEVVPKSEGAATALVIVISETLGLSLDADSDPEERVLTYLKAKRILLLLDNFEHLLDATSLVLNLLQVAPTIKILITSRERLKLLQGQVIQLNGLSRSKFGVFGDFQSRLQGFWSHLFRFRLQKTTYFISENRPNLTQKLDIDWQICIYVNCLARILSQNLKFGSTGSCTSRNGKYCRGPLL